MIRADFVAPLLISGGAKLLRDVAAQNRPLTEKLDILRDRVGSFETVGAIDDWGRHNLGLDGETLADWSRQVWWGCIAGELVRAYLWDRAHANEALDLVLPSGLAPPTSLYPIRIGMHLGPPRVALIRGALNYKKFSCWAPPNTVPLWVRERPSFRFSPLVHIKDEHSVVYGPVRAISKGATFYADLGYSDMRGRIGLYSKSKGSALDTALPRMLWQSQLTACLDLVLWKNGSLIAIEVPVGAPQADLPVEQACGLWLERVRCEIDPLLRASPENLRFLLFNGRSFGDSTGVGVNIKSVQRTPKNSTMTSEIVALPRTETSTRVRPTNLVVHDPVPTVSELLPPETIQARKAANERRTVAEKREAVMDNNFKRRRRKVVFVTLFLLLMVAIRFVELGPVR